MQDGLEGLFQVASEQLQIARYDAGEALGKFVEGGRFKHGRIPVGEDYRAGKDSKGGKPASKAGRGFG
ncbi:hypothetical protein JCM19379_28440 [Methyloparacoccus murrellii]